MSIVEVVKAWESGSTSKTLVIAIPKRVKERLNLGKGERFKLSVAENDDKIILEPLRL